MSETIVKYLGHTTVLIECGPDRIIIDPNFSSGMPLARRQEKSVFDPHELHDIAGLLISNPRLNRLDQGSLKFFKQRKTRVVIAKGLGQYIKRFFNFAVSEMEAGQSVSFGEIHVTAIPRRHFSVRFLMPHKISLNFIIQTPDKTIFYGSDLKYDKDFFTQLGESYKIDLAILPIDYVGSSWVNRGNFLTMHDALRAFEDLGARLLLPNGHSAFVWLGRNPMAARQLLEQELEKNRSLKEKVHILNPGATLAI